MHLKNLRILFQIIILLILILLSCMLFYLQRIYSNNENNNIIIIKKTVNKQHNLTSINLLLKCDAKLLKFNNNCNQTHSFRSTINKDCRLVDNNKYYYYHTIWEIESDKTNFQFRVLDLNLASYLATQNLLCSKLILWIMRNKFPRNKLEFIKAKYLFYFDKNNLQIEYFNLSKLCKLSSSFSQHKLCSSNSTQNELKLDFYNSVELSDFVRIFILDIYGGIYVDGDVVFLKDMSILWNLNFAYRWSFLDRVNNAVIGISNREIFQNKLIKTIKDHSNTNDDLIRNFNPIKLSYYLKVLNSGSIYDYEPFRVMHSYLFDPAWLCNDGILSRYDSKSVCSFKEFISNQFLNYDQFSIGNFYPGVFTYHLHLKNLRPKYFNKYSYFSYLENYFASIIKSNLNQDVTL